METSTSTSGAQWIKRSVLFLASILIGFYGPACNQQGVAQNGNDNFNVNANENLCDCLNPNDVYSASGCVRSDFTCNALNPCDVGYRCDWENNCVCTDREVCGLACDGECGCPNEYECIASSDTCEPELPCISDSMCVGDEKCQRSTSRGYYCRIPVGLDDGEQCDRNEDCASQICETNICLERCNRNADCQDGQYCQVFSRLGGCVVDRDCFECDGPNQICHGPSCLTACLTSGDCDDDCYSILSAPLISYCKREWNYDCESNEFYVGGEGPGIYCVIHQPCRIGVTDCPTDYECIGMDRLDMGMPYDASIGLCARNVIYSP